MGRHSQSIRILTGSVACQSSAVRSRRESLDGTSQYEEGQRCLICISDECRLYSTVNAFPAMKHASTSSLPIIPHVPVIKS